jgi:sterol desaturase/sphingolipid hydroxylase (fatty acid hydroxylase superfamily)
MHDAPLAYEPALRFGFFAGLFVVLAAWEWINPRRKLSIGRRLRWASNLGIIGLDTLLVRILFPSAAVGVALLAETRGWGLFNVLQLPAAVTIVSSVLLLDLAIYLQHVAFHAVPALWRLHRMHHADLDLDATTGVRFHPLEIFLSMLIKFAVVAALGAPALAVLVFEIILNATSMFNHSNVRLPPAIDAVARLLVVTPDMHRVHHSIVRAETDSNFGFNFPWWDRIFGTYRRAPAAGHGNMVIGIESFRDPASLRLDQMLMQPFAQDRQASPALGQKRAEHDQAGSQ